MTKSKYEAYEKFDDDANFQGLAKNVIEEAKKQNLPIEANERRVETALKNDVQNSIPAQILALIGSVASAVERAEKKVKE